MLTLQLPEEEEDTCHWDKVDIVEQQGSAPSRSFTLRPGQAPSDDMLAFLRLMNIAGAPPAAAERVARPHSNSMLRQSSVLVGPMHQPPTSVFCSLESLLR